MLVPLPKLRRATTADHRPTIARIARLAPLLGSLLIGVVMASPARAISVTVNGSNFDLELFNGSFDSDASLFATPAGGGRMPWWGDSTLAEEFAVQLGAGLSPTPLPAYGPLFAHTFMSAAPATVVASALDLPTLGITDLVDSSYTAPSSSAQSYAVLVAPPSTASVPAPLPILGAVAAFRATRRLRKRCKS